jgi:hypothetical protein
MMTITRQTGSAGPNQDAEQAPNQIELPFKVPVCAWCRPGELGDRLGAISHGICPRHFQQLLLDCAAGFSSAALNVAVSLVRDTHRLVQAELESFREFAA